MKVQEFVGLLGAEFYTGVPDSLLRPLGDYLMDIYGTDPYHHVIAVNEGNAAALAAGYYLAPGGILWFTCKTAAKEMPSIPPFPCFIKRSTPFLRSLSSAGGESRGRRTNRSTSFRGRSPRAS